MPLDRLLPEPHYNFLGVNLRQDLLSMGDGDMARAINGDLHSKPGVILLRKGMTPHDTFRAPAPIRQIARHNGRLYRLAGGILYRGDATPVSVMTGLSTVLPVGLASYRPLNDTAAWTFMVQGSIWRKDNGELVRIWGIVAPTTAPVAAVGAAGSLTGAYTAQYTYVRLVGTAVAHESNPSPASNAVTLASEVLSVPVVASTDPQVNRIRLYRTVAGGTLHLFDQEVPNTTATLTSSKADTALGAQVESGNNPPPPMHAIAEYQGHFFGVGDPEHPDYLYYSKRFRPESWPSDQFLRIGTVDDPLQAVMRQSGFLGVFSERTKYRVSGNSISGFIWAETINTRGSVAPQAILVTSAGTLFWARDGIFLTNFLQAEQELSAAIAPLFETEGATYGYVPINWTQARTFSLSSYKRRLYAGYVDTDGRRFVAVWSRDTSKWYHYAMQCTALFDDESSDTLLMGTTGGQVMILERGTTDDGSPINLDVQTRTLSGQDRFVRKIFKFLKLDVEARGGGGTVTLFIDDVSHQKITVTSPLRSTLRSPIRLQDVHGYGWALEITGEVQVYGAVMLFSPLEAT